jgi:cobalt-zinc-cadmium efflux system outer membrane protein
MINCSLGRWPIVVALAVTGCAPATQSVKDPVARPLGGDLPGPRPPRAVTERAPESFTEPAGSLTLRDALVAALTRSPELAAYAWELRAREADALQAGLRPNPELSAELENFAGSGDLRGFHSYETTVALAQLIELGGKRGKRIAVANHEQALAAWDYETARIDVLTETTKAFLDVLAAQAQVAVADDLVAVAEQVLASVAARVRAGSTSPVEESRAKVEVETSLVQRDRVGRTLAAARRRLSAMWGTSEPEFSDAVGTLEEIAEPPSLEALQSRLEQNPDLARWASELDHRRAVLESERSQRTPDLTLGTGVRYSREASETSVVLELGVPLPLFDRHQGASAAAEWQVRRATEERRAAAVRVQLQLAIAHDALLGTWAEIEALRDRALPEAEVAFDAAGEAYRRGAMRFTDVLDTERLLFELKSSSIDALARYHATVADLERLTGEPLGTAHESIGRP